MKKSPKATNKVDWPDRYASTISLPDFTTSVIRRGHYDVHWYGRYFPLPVNLKEQIVTVKEMPFVVEFKTEAVTDADALR